MADFVHMNTPSATITLVANTSNRVALPAVGRSAVYVHWNGTDPVYMACGNSTVVASQSAGSLTSFLEAGGTKTFAIDPTATHVAAVTTGSGTLLLAPTSGNTSV